MEWPGKVLQAEYYKMLLMVHRVDVQIINCGTFDEDLSTRFAHFLCHYGVFSITKYPQNQAQCGLRNYRATFIIRPFQKVQKK